MCLKLSFSYSKWVFISDFVPDCQTVFLAVQILTPLFSLTVSNFVVFFTSLGGKFKEDFKNVLKTVISSLQVDFKDDFASDCPLNCVSGNSNLDTAFLPDCTKFFSVFSWKI